ncbi:ABC transporter substrate-binding protein [Rubrivirga sp.]|uniref:ABC transporter substrate-binding protein n=1 Tax=Rubrivirga sp. TaxID=1885344 RepID=UPI003B529E32
MPRCLVLLVGALAWAGCAADAPSPVRDDLGRAVALDGTATVLGLAPNLTELVATAAGTDRLAGVGVSDDFPPGIDGLPRVQMLPLDTEAVVALDPDLAFGSDDVNTADAADALGALGVPTYLFRFDEVADVPRALRTLDTLLASTGGARAAADFERRVAAVQSAVQPFSPPRVLLLVGDETLYAFGRDSYASELVRLAGGDNLTDVYDGAAAQPSDEVVLEMAPEVIVVLAGPDYDPARLLERHPTFFSLPAVQNGRVYGLDPDLVSRPGPRLVEGLERLARLLHPEAFAAGAA